MSVYGFEFGGESRNQPGLRQVTKRFDSAQARPRGIAVSWDWDGREGRRP